MFLAESSSVSVHHQVVSARFSESIQKTIQQSTDIRKYNLYLGWTIWLKHISRYKSFLLVHFKNY